ncbi:OmpA family protein [Flavobacterium agricola]|uniref:OmpA family protein n=1 Tax=Flavobacterium agricola TaxID=2870839 RepID=A0ABY6LZY8_9FLAO|nr:OmpA family protein [Flavobacterium agricola]UYW01592.1 OmpA family protein [Flavobacterium agricola]
MKKISLFVLSGAFVMSGLFTSCDSVKNANNTQKGAGIGVAAGAVIGGILGNNLGKGGNGALGAVIGGVVGGATGAVIGKKMDNQANEIKEAVPGVEVERVGEGIKLVLGENAIQFEFNKSTLTAKAKQNLDKLTEVFKEYPDTDITIYGYTDNKGSDEVNLRISKQRATAVKDYLVAQGLKASRFAVEGLGKADPIATNDTDAGRALNRRVEFSIVANEKMQADAEREANR